MARRVRRGALTLIVVVGDAPIVGFRYLSTSLCGCGNERLHTGCALLTNAIKNDDYVPSTLRYNYMALAIANRRSKPGKAR